MANKPNEMEAEPVIAVSVKMPNGEVRGFEFGEGNELEVGTLVQLVGILKALRAIMKVPENQSILSHCVTMVRRYETYVGFRSWPPFERTAWIPVTTALPKDKQIVLVKGDNDYLGKPHWVALAFRDQEYRGEQWLNMHNDRLSDMGWEPTHWREVANLLED